MGAIGNSAVLFCAKGSLKTSEASFSEAKTSEASFSEAKTSEASFSEAKTSKASFSEAKTSKASFRLPLLVYNVMSSKSANSGWRAK